MKFQAQKQKNFQIKVLEPKMGVFLINKRRFEKNSIKKANFSKKKCLEPKMEKIKFYQKKNPKRGQEKIFF